MERLTEYIDSQGFYGLKCKLGVMRHTNFNIDKAIDKLAEYENLEEQKMLAKFPYKVGTKIWIPYLELNRVGQHEIYKIEIIKDDCILYADNGNCYTRENWKHLYFIKEDAEKRLIKRTSFS